MIAYLLYALAALIAGYVVYDLLLDSWRRLKKGFSKKSGSKRERLALELKKKFKVIVGGLGVIAVVLGLIFLFIKGGTVIQVASTVALLGFGAMRRLGIAYRIFSVLFGFYAAKKASAGHARSRSAGKSKMSPQEAARLLEIPVDSDKDKIIAAYRRKMRNSHPDHGGSNEGAQRINAARECLLNHWERTQ